MKKTKGHSSAALLSAALMLLLSTLLIAVMPTEREGAIYGDTVRLHILANSDGDSDQQIKLEIRDRLLAEYGTGLSAQTDREAAEERLSELLPEIESSVSLWLAELGVDYGCRAELGTEWYETREYGELTLPRGYYTSLRIMLGEGEGRNWWCVMFPPMCLGIATETAPGDDALIQYTKEEYRLISEGGYSVKFKLLELAADALRQLSKKD